MELNSFFRKVKKENITVSKQAFLNARDKISSDLFKDLYIESVDGFYEQCDNYKTWNRYRLTAIDGSIIEVPNTEKLREIYDIAKNQHKDVARARISCIYDVLNKLIIRCSISGYRSSERDEAKLIIQDLINTSRLEKELILFDRGYPSVKLISFLIKNEIDFLMRSPKNYSKVIMNAKKEDQIDEIKYKGDSYKIRIIRLKLDSGEEEILITSLLDEKMSKEDFKKLYFMRWSIEVSYDDLKNKFQIENFSGINQNTIEQEIYATIYLSNIYEFAGMNSQAIIDKRNKKKQLKYEYKQNKNILIGTLKEEFISIILIKNDWKRNKKINEIIKIISKNTLPIRSNRNNPRIIITKRTKFFQNKRKCL